jgi:Phosphotransferase enzyme family
MELTADELAASVAAVLGRDPSALAILARQRNVQTSTWPSEIVECRVGCDGGLRLLLKHGPRDAHNAHGHPVGPAYEAIVYETVLAPAGLSHPFLGSVCPPGSRSMCLVLEYLDQGWWRMNLAEDVRTIVRVAAWLGAFHRAATERTDALASALNVYDTEYYKGWARRSLRYVPELPDAFRWLGQVCRGFGRLGAHLASGPLTVVHGEFYPHNVLVHGDAVRPVDWEWAAVAAGEVDLAALTEGWGPVLAAASERAYAHARWPDGAPDDFLWRLDVARVYMHLRWLGDRKDRAASPHLAARLADLEVVASRVGIA